MPLRSRFNLHDFVNRVFFGHAAGPPAEVTRDSLRSISDTLGREQSMKLGLVDEPASSYNYDVASRSSFFSQADAGEEEKAAAGADVI